MYPAGQPLHECEIRRIKSVPSAWGGFSDCWEGVFLERHKVAMKSLRHNITEDVAQRRIKREIAVWKGLNHRNILPFIGIHILDDTTYMVSPWMGKGDSLQYVRLNPLVDRLKLLVQIAEGVRYLHRHDPVVIHGDLKGANIFISDSGEACIADFGLSHMTGENTESYSTAWRAAGSVRWQAPELMVERFDEAVRTTASDIFAFGRVIVELITGNIPYYPDVTNDMMIPLKVLGGVLPKRPTDPETITRGLDDRIWELVEDCCRMKPHQRAHICAILHRLRSALKARDAGPPLLVPLLDSSQSSASPTRGRG
ncbi:hypothetical protein BOTBODRAFT_162563 [Botryobasidium botryosum FD-172 SS1]|uniref:Protein kinase domain-containing protein n=1 Tax=Botryobasidium botryosum (strain FD-172 SS1) TaxID=930990 RepID=A0A067MJJ2_BOTB1|nr:hypothetical protein BOTBODRAFT_162563 [Botryobasidium botryosum FD-172 SS1]